MCEPAAILKKKDSEEVIMDAVGRLTFDGDKIVMETLFGDRKEVEGSIQEVNFMENRIVIQAG